MVLNVTPVLYLHIPTSLIWSVTGVCLLSRNGENLFWLFGGVSTLLLRDFWFTYVPLGCS